MRFELAIRLKRFPTSDVHALMRFDIQVSRLVVFELMFQFTCLFALLARLSVNVVAYKVKDALV